MASGTCRMVDVAHLLGCSIGTIKNRRKDNPAFLAAYEKGAARAKKNIALRLYRAAMEGNVIALIYLSKVHLHWSDRPVAEGTDARESARKIQNAVQEMKDASGPVTGET